MNKDGVKKSYPGMVVAWLLFMPFWALSVGVAAVWRGAKRLIQGILK